MNKIDVAREQLLAVLASTDHPKEIAISCIGKLLRGEFRGDMSDDSLGDFVESIALHEGLTPTIAQIGITSVCMGCAGQDPSGPLELFVFLPSIKLDDRPNHSGEENRGTKNATLLHDWYSEAIRRASPEIAEDHIALGRAIAMRDENASHAM